MKRIIKFLASLVLVVAFLGFFAVEAIAIERPLFPSCTNPSGTIKVSYDSGIHGIVGDASVHQGRDTVYTVGEGTFSQCFCAQDGTNGIQTNWWKVSSLTQDEIQILKNEGWYLIPNGALWGLDEAPYMAQNANYACRSQGTILASAASTSNDPQVLGLATTGNAILILIVFGLSIFVLLLSILAYKLDSNK